MHRAERGGDDDKAAESPFPKSCKAGSKRAQMARARPESIDVSLPSISGTETDLISAFRPVPGGIVAENSDGSSTEA